MQNHHPKRASAVLAAFAVASLALAGCFGDDEAPDSGSATTTTNGQPTNGDNGNTTSRPIANRADLLDCKSLLVAHYVQRAQVADYLPQGFTPVSLIPGTATLNLEYYDCRAMVASNQTTTDHATMTIVGTAVSAPEAYHTSGVSNFFVLEWFADSDGLLDFLRGHGASVELGHAFVNFETPESRLEVNGEVLYQTTPADKPESDPDPLLQRKQHFYTHIGVSSAFFNLTAVEEDSRPSGAITTAGGGFLSEFTFPPVNRVLGVNAHGIYSGYLEVKHYD